MKVLFVCTANIVRSFMAENILKEKLRKNGRSDIEVSSAGIIDMMGKPADPVAVKILREKGIQSDIHFSRFLTEEMVADADLIAVMEENHKFQLDDRYPAAESKIRILKSFMKWSPGVGYDISDPYGLKKYHYRRCFSEISTAIDAMLDVL